MACLTVPHFLPGLPTDAAATLDYLSSRPEMKHAGAQRSMAAFGAVLTWSSGTP